MANGLLGDPTALRGLLQSPSTTDFALAMLANSGYSPRRRSLGEIVGASMLQSRQMAAEQAQQKLREEYMRAQIQAMQQRPQAQQRAPFNLGDPTTYTRESVAEFQRTGDYSVLEPIPAAPVEKQFPLGAGGMLVDAEGNVLVRNPSRGQGPSSVSAPNPAAAPPRPSAGPPAGAPLGAAGETPPSPESGPPGKPQRPLAAAARRR